jgi:hypothetical protein
LQLQEARAALSVVIVAGWLSFEAGTPETTRQFEIRFHQAEL